MRRLTGWPGRLKEITLTRLKLSMLILQILFGKGQSIMGLNITRTGLDSCYWTIPNLEED